jgi:hypothetical protein
MAEATGSDAQSDATLGAARLDYGTTAPSTHANEKPVGTFASYNRWLVGSFHDICPGGGYEKRVITSPILNRVKL